MQADESFVPTARRFRILKGLFARRLFS